MECIFYGKIISDDSTYCQYCGELVDSSPKIVARNKSLNNKTREELIKIILRKDKTERSQNKKIQELMRKLSSSTDTSQDIELKKKDKCNDERESIIW